ncbi:MAG: hypothetical protein H7Z41_18490 [Cytophagales bacterium]|nr:hypothetical protein [Armatimonadota bacterium]
MTVVAYVSGHGFGHSAREVEILRRLPSEIPLVVTSAAPEWFWRQEVRRPFEFVADAFDVGCIQTSSLDVDVPATLAAWQSMDTRNQARLAETAEELRRRGAQVVVTDVGSFPITVAEQIGIPSLCVANFTWADIYADYVDEEPAFAPIVASLNTQYSRATRLLETDLSLPMACFPRRESVGLVARQGTPRRPELLERLGVPAHGKRLALIYAGNWGLPVPWQRLEAFDDWHFVSLAPFDAAARNASHLPQSVLPHPDFVASVDLVISKPGYGSVGECLAAGTPFLYCPRTGFAEYAALDAALSSWPGGLRLPAERFLAADWGAALSRVPPPGSISPLPAPGGAAAAARIADHWRG